MNIGTVITLTLPKPLSVNNLFFNVPGKGRVPSFNYKRWKKEAAQEILMVQRPGHISGPVEIHIQVREGRADLDGQVKCCLDALVDNGVIDGDGHKIVRKLIVEFGDVVGARIAIMHATASPGRGSD